VKTNIELLIQKQKDDDKKKDGQNKDDQKDKDQNKKDKDGKSGDPKDNKPDDKDGDKKNEKQKQDRKQNTKYQPRPFKGDQLSEGDVKKILGELSQQDKKIRSQFDKKEKIESPYEGKNEKDW
jgi:Ca-activated chloride channel homolog